jgi:hypothetical protein
VSLSLFSLLLLFLKLKFLSLAGAFLFLFNATKPPDGSSPLPRRRLIFGLMNSLFNMVLSGASKALSHCTTFSIYRGLHAFIFLCVLVCDFVPWMVLATHSHSFVEKMIFLVSGWLSHVFPSLFFVCARCWCYTRSCRADVASEYSSFFFFALATLRSSYGEASPLNLKYSTQEQQGIISAY